MSNVYVLRKNVSQNIPSSGGLQVNVGGNGKKLDYSEMSPAAAKWGQYARYASAVPAAWTALSSLANNSQNDLFSSMGSAGLGASATYGLANSALEPAAAKFGERRNLKNNPTHYNENGEYIGPPEDSGPIDAEFTEEEISPTQLPENASGNIASPEGKQAIEMTRGTDGIYRNPSTDAMNQEAVKQSQSNSLAIDPVYPNNPGGVKPMEEVNRSIMNNSQNTLNNYGNYGQ